MHPNDPVPATDPAAAPPANRRGQKIAFAAVAVSVFLLLAWLDSRWKWKGERELKRGWIWTHAGRLSDANTNPPAPRDAPWSLRILGEPGVTEILLDEVIMIRQLRMSEDRDADLVAKKLSRLFPEASIRIRDYRGNEKMAVERP